MAILFPVLLMETGSEQPPPGSPFWYEIAENGIFVAKRSGVVHSLTPVSSGGIPGLASREPSADLCVDMLPVEQLAVILHFFHYIYETLHTEVNLLLYYNSQTNEWFPYCPDQTVTEGSVQKYDNDVVIPGYDKIGTIHSHGNFGAFHSHTDHKDESGLDGLHAVVSRVSSGHPEIVMSIVINGHVFDKDPTDYFRGLVWEDVQETFVPPPVKRTPMPSRSRAPLPASKWGFTEILGMFMTSQRSLPPLPIELAPPAPATIIRTRRRLTLQLPEGTTITDFPFPKEWLERVYTTQRPKTVVVVKAEEED